jgi:hypothetical protein
MSRREMNGRGVAANNAPSVRERLVAAGERLFAERTGRRSVFVQLLLPRT